MAGLMELLTGIAEGVGGELQERAKHKRKLEEVYAEAQAKQQALAADPTGQLSRMLLLKQLGLDNSSPTPEGSPVPPSPTPSSQPVPQPVSSSLYPGQVPLETGSRYLQRVIGMRETPKALMESYSAKTAAAAKGFGDTGNVAVEERKMIGTSFPKDGESAQARQTRRNSLNAFFDQKEAFLQGLINKPTEQMVVGFSGRSGIRTQADPAVMAARKQASLDLQRMQQTRVLYNQMYDEADRLMPAIGGSTPSATSSPAVAEARRRGLIR